MVDKKTTGARLWGLLSGLTLSSVVGHVMWVAKWGLKGPIVLYRYSLSALVGRQCRHEPSCSLYALEAIELNGAWKGFWLTLSRVYRCGPGGSHGYDPAPDLREVTYPLYKCWKYGVWRKR